MKIVNHDDKGATLHLDQRELLMVMALVQEGRDSFECEGETGSAIDQLFCTANVKVEEARRAALRSNMQTQKIGTVAAPNDGGFPEGLAS